MVLLLLLLRQKVDLTSQLNCTYCHSLFNVVDAKAVLKCCCHLLNDIIVVVEQVEIQYHILIKTHLVTLCMLLLMLRQFENAVFRLVMTKFLLLLMHFLLLLYRQLCNTLHCRGFAVVNGEAA